MDDATADILNSLENITTEEKDLQKSLEDCKLRRSNLLYVLQNKVGKSFTRKGVTYTICKRGDTYFTKSTSGKVIPVLD